jgi:hypothetical protein
MICIICLVNKERSGFYDSLAKTGQVCRTCIILRANTWSIENKKRRAEIKHISYAKSVGKHPEECRRITVKKPKKKIRKKLLSKQEILKRCYAKNKEKFQARGKKWRASNPHKLRQYTAKRRAADALATPTWLNFVQLAQIDEMHEICKAKSVQTGIKHHVDHIFPMRSDVLCGLNVPWNLQILTASKNISKQRKFPEQYQHMAWSNA